MFWWFVVRKNTRGTQCLLVCFVSGVCVPDNFNQTQFSFNFIRNILHKWTIKITYLAALLALGTFFICFRKLLLLYSIKWFFSPFKKTRNIFQLYYNTFVSLSTFFYIIYQDLSFPNMTSFNPRHNDPSSF